MYEDIINLPHPESRTHPRMSMRSRAAQFAPFAALNGHAAALQETARQTEAERCLDANDSEYLDRQMALLRQLFAERPEVCITYFEPDERKAGGAYRSVVGYIQKIDAYAQTMLLSDGTLVPFRSVLSMEGDVFDVLR